MKKKIVWFIIFALLIVVIIIASLFINKKGIEYLQGEKQENIINENKEEENMSVIKVNDDTFEQEVLKSSIPVLVDFYADWCGPCRMMSPIIDEIAEEMGESVKVGKINVDNNQELAIKYDVMSIPTFVVIKDGKETGRSVGVQDKSEILSMLS